MKRLCTFLVLLASACAYGQVGPVSITSAECATIGVGAKVSVITFQVTGTWTGTLQPKITVQGQAAANVQVTPSTSSTAQSTVTANGIYTAQVNGADTFQVCGNTVASGTANVYLNTSVASKGGSSGSGSSGTVTSVATTSPIGGGTITATGTVTCTTCVVASSPGVGLAHFAGSTQTATSSAVVAADITSGTITGTQLSSSIALPNGATATTQSASDNSTKVATTAYVDRASPALVQLETHTASSSAELDFTTCISSTYKTYKIVVRNLVPATNATNLDMQFSSDGGATYLADGHYTSVAWRFNTGGGAAASVSNANQFRIDSNPGSGTVDNTAAFGVIGDYLMYDPQSVTLNKRLTGEAADSTSGGTMEAAPVNLIWATSGTAANAFRLKFEAGNIASGTATCYGLTP